MRAFVLLSLVLLCPAALPAQGNPADFNRPGPVREREMYYAQVRTEINQLLIRWRDAWENDDAGRLAAFYTDQAIYFPLNGSQTQTRSAIEAHFAEFLRSVGTVNINLSGFGMSGDLAYVTCRVTYHLLEGTAARRVVRTDLLVLRRNRNHGWQIEVQFAQEEPEKALP